MIRNFTSGLLSMWGFLAFLLTSAQHLEIKQVFDRYGFEGCFVLLDESTNNYIKYNHGRCARRFTPASTFKIPNTIIALEAGIATDENTVYKWDGEIRTIKTWNQDLSLKEAFRYSCVPCYLSIAGEVGELRYKQYLQEFDYGNQDISIVFDEPALQPGFWLIGNLKISPDEQIAFLRKIYHNKLPVSHRTMDIFKTIFLEEENERYQLYGKTGWGIDRENELDIGWYVGYTVVAGKVYYFATNIEKSGEDDSFLGARKRITMEILGQLLPNFGDQ